MEYMILNQIAQRIYIILGLRGLCFEMVEARARIRR